MMEVQWLNFFVGKDTLVCDAYGIKSQKQFINTLYDNIKSRGAMNTIITYGGNKNMKYQRKLLTYSEASSSNNMNQNHTINIKTNLSNAMVL